MNEISKTPIKNNQEPSSKDQDSEQREVVDEHRMPLTEHLQELRNCLIRSIIGYFIASIICYSYAKELFTLLKYPISSTLAKYPGSTFALRSVSEGFMVDLKVAAIAGLFLSSPYLFYQLWKFISPGLYEHERRMAFPIIFSASVLFVVGATFGYGVIFPKAFDFLLSYAGNDTSAILSISEYLDLTAKLLTVFGVIFELPLVIFVLASFGIVNHVQLKKVRSYAIVVNFVVAAVITPPDVISQMGVALPLVFLYEIGIFIAWLVGKKRNK